MKEISYEENIDILNRAEKKYISKYMSDKVKNLLCELKVQPKITMKLPEEIRLEYFDDNEDKYIDLLINSSNHTASLTYKDWSDGCLYNDKYDLNGEVLELAGKINDIVYSEETKTSNILNSIFAGVDKIIYRPKTISDKEKIEEDINLDNIPTEVLQKEIKKREKEEIPKLVKQINENLNKLEQYGYNVHNDSDDAVLLNHLEIEDNNIYYYEFYTE